MSVEQVVEFYRGAGRQLVARESYPSEVVAYLEQERQAARRVASTYEIVVEVGCMDGGLLYEVLGNLPVVYLGIDVVDGAIETFRSRLRAGKAANAGALTLDVAHVDQVGPLFAGRRVLAVFPFNSFGNLAKPEAALESTARAGMDVWIGTYQTTAPATRIRHDYYCRSNLAAVIQARDDRGVLFSSSDGLYSYAYEDGWLTRRLDDSGFSVDIRQSGPLASFVHGRRR